MQRVFVLLFLFCLSSCEYFDAKKVSSEDILKEELKTFNWNEVDTYPSFAICDSVETKVEKKECFENTLSQHITTSLQNEIIIVSQDINETITLEFQISEIGQINIKNINLSQATEAQIPEIKIKLTKSLNTLPQIFPALKRDQPVKTEFTLPIQIVVN